MATDNHDFIDSIDDPRIAVYRDLPNQAANSDYVIAEGRWLVERLLQSELEIISVLCVNTVDEDFSRLTRSTPVYVAPRTLVEKVVGFRFHRGVLACAVRPASPAIETVCKSALDRSAIAVCCGVSDRENLGGIIRTAAAFGVHGLVVGPNCADPFSRRVLRVSMGASLQLPIVQTADLSAAIVTLKQHQFNVVATVLDKDATELKEARQSNRIAIVLGNEGFGVSDSVVEGCDQQVTLPMDGAIDSLNVAVAAGIFLHHFKRTY